METERKTTKGKKNNIRYVNSVKVKGKEREENSDSKLMNWRETERATDRRRQ